MTDDIIIVSTPYVPGYKITKNLGFTWGLVVRSRGIGGNFVAGLRTIFGGEIHEYTELLNQSRGQALDRLKANARSMGANAVVSVDFDSSELAQFDDRSARNGHRRLRRDRDSTNQPGAARVKSLFLSFSRPCAVSQRQ